MKLKRFNSTPWLLAVACVIAQFGNIGIDGKHVVVAEEEEQARKAKMGGGSSYYLRHQTNVSEEEADSSSFFGSLKLPSLKVRKVMQQGDKHYYDMSLSLFIIIKINQPKSSATTNSLFIIFNHLLHRTRNGRGPYPTMERRKRIVRRRKRMVHLKNVVLTIVRLSR